LIRTLFWIAIIVGALAAIVAGFAQGTLATHPPPLAELRRPNPRAKPAPPSSAPIAADRSGAPASDVFAQDPVMIERPRERRARWQAERLAIVVGRCGYSLAVDAQFLRLNVPMAFVIEPRAPQAAAFAALVRGQHDVLFVQRSGPPSMPELARLRGQLGAFDGIAARDARGMPDALRNTGLTFFDERGDSADPAQFAAANVRLVRRDVTADNRSELGYVAFMLDRAATLSQRTGPVVVFVRPLPSTLAALRQFDSDRNARMIALR